ncbi:MAG: TIGR00159 family protein [Bacteroidaceae bacterium]|nr:TIGR00159 family protein [Bacteroidaceae bacterium]
MLGIELKDVIDIFLVAVILYYCYQVMKTTRSVNIFYGVLIFIVFWILISKTLDMSLLGGILDQLVSVGAIALIVLFQDEIRHFLYRLGTHDKTNRLLKWFHSEKRNSLDPAYRNSSEDVIQIVRACSNMSKQHVGALIVMQNDQSLGDFAKTGEGIDGKVSQRLIENIFFKNSPLHDGAMIINGSKIVAAACILPISHDIDIPKEFGLRHRAAKGITQETDSLAITVSEETGNITAAYGGYFKSHITTEELERLLMKGKF